MVTFRLNLSGLLRWFAPTIEVRYDIQTRQLARFRGLANLRDDQGEQVNAWIDFRSEEHTSELQSLMRISSAVFRLKNKKMHIHISQANLIQSSPISAML